MSTRDRHFSNDSVFSQDLGHLAETLSDKQRLVIQRLISEFLTSIPKDGDEEMSSIPMIREAAKDLMSFVDVLRKYEAIGSDIQPFSISFPSPGRTEVLISPRMNTWTQFSSEEATSWAGNSYAAMITLDFSRLTEGVTSTVLAWMVTIAQKNKMKKVYVKNANNMIKRSVQTLRLGGMVVFVDDGNLKMH
jgi:hypothetical protein